jgi:predicted deacylase
MVQLPGVDGALPLFLGNSGLDGPTTVILGGVHGCEYTTIDAAIQLLNLFKKLEYCGRIAIVPVASMAAYSSRSLYVHPEDRKNVNRLFPGNPDGTVSERLADAIYRTFVLPSDVFIDLHGGDMCEALVPHIYYFRTPDADLNQHAYRFAQHFCLPFVYGSSALNSAYQSAAVAGKVAVLVEGGQLGVVDPTTAAALVKGCLNALRFEGIIPGGATEPVGQTDIRKYLWIESDLFGAWYPAVKVGDRVVTGQKMGETRNLFGDRLREYQAEDDGVVLFCVTSLVTNPGDALYAIGCC